MENDTPRRMPNVPPFVKFVCANVPMVFDDSLSYYEALCALWKYVQGMTDVINNNATLEEEFIEKFNVLSGKFDDLKTYVDTYFDNLDVQEEINNKLDAMVEDGTMTSLLSPLVDDYVAETNGRLSDVESDVNTMKQKMPEYKPITMVQDLSLTFPRNTSIQAMCVDDSNNIYIYDATNAPNGDLYKYRLDTHAYVSTISSVHLHHGNGMIYKNGKLYVAPLTADDDTKTNKTIDVYDIANDTVTVLSPFADLSYANVSTITDYDEDHVIVGLNEYSASSNTVDVHLVKLNLNTLEYTEITKVWFSEVSPSRISSILYLNGKIYMITESPEYIFEMIYDDENYTATENKVYKIPKKNDLGIDIGELEGSSILPSGLYGDNTFAFSSFRIGNEVGGLINYTVYLSNFESDLPEYFGDSQDTNIMGKQRDIYVKATATTNIENGTSSYPFHDINTAIEVANSGQYAVQWIIIQDSETYQIGKQTNRKFSIKPKDNTVSPTLKINNLISCDVRLTGNTMTITKSGTDVTNLVLTNSRAFIQGCAITTAFYTSHGTQLIIQNCPLTIDYDIANVFDMYATNASLYLGTVGGTGTTTRLIRAFDGSIVYLNHAHQSATTAIGACSVITVTAS